MQLLSLVLLFFSQPDVPLAPQCQKRAACARLDYGFHSAFCFPSVRGIKTGKRITDVDYANRAFTIPSGDKTYFVLHGAGPLWGSGSLPDPSTVSDYSKRSFRSLQGDPVHDVRWTSPSGNRNRILSRPFETAAYRDVPPPQAAALDKLLDGYCILPVKYP
ncbi:MAG: hypothetical protein JNK48_15065 [Bryobacterales bacterium]|nr:hypothetical protein [Bryobacterales bacterium]